MADVISILDRANRPEESRATVVLHGAPPPDRVRPLSEIAQLANVSLTTLRRLIKAGSGPRLVQVSPRRCGVTDLDFLTWLEARAK